jgi:hypothetical protein
MRPEGAAPAQLAPPPTCRPGYRYPNSHCFERRHSEWTRHRRFAVLHRLGQRSSDLPQRRSAPSQSTRLSSKTWCWQVDFATCWRGSVSFFWSLMSKWQAGRSPSESQGRMLPIVSQSAQRLDLDCCSLPSYSRHWHSAIGETNLNRPLIQRHPPCLRPSPNWGRWAAEGSRLSGRFQA